jgi:pimeloyl-ACP methyl ester carboxylesterase
MTTFALVHGAWHGAACWDMTAAALRAAGHDAIAVDLPIDNPAAGLVDYAATVLESLAALPSDADLVVVGHSLGGLTIPLVAAARPIRELVFLCALVPMPGVALEDDLFALPDTFAAGWPALAAQQQGHGDGSSTWPAEAAVDAFYDDCPPEVALAAVSQLRRQHWGVAREPHPLLAYPALAARAIVCTEDKVLNAESCARHAAERAGASVARIPGGHCPMVAQPDLLAALLTSVAAA